MAIAIGYKCDYCRKEWTAEAFHAVKKKYPRIRGQACPDCVKGAKGLLRNLQRREQRRPTLPDYDIDDLCTAGQGNASRGARNLIDAWQRRVDARAAAAALADASAAISASTAHSSPYDYTLAPLKLSMDWTENRARDGRAARNVMSRPICLQIDQPRYAALLQLWQKFRRTAGARGGRGGKDPATPLHALLALFRTDSAFRAEVFALNPLERAQGIIEAIQATQEDSPR